MSSAFRLRNNSLFIMAEAPGGLYNSAQLKLIASLTDNDTAMVKVTEDQRIGLFVEEQNLGYVEQQLESVGLGWRHYQHGQPQPVSCLGEMCPEHQQDAMGAAMDMAEHLSQMTENSGLKIGVNGCARCCVPCHTMDISIVGDDHGYKIRVGGKSAELPEIGHFLAEGVPEAELPGRVRGVVELFHKHKEGDETFQDVIERCGLGAWVECLSPYSRDAAGADDGLLPPLEDSEAVSENEVLDPDEFVPHDESTEDLGADIGGDDLEADIGGEDLEADIGDDDLEADIGGEDLESDINETGGENAVEDDLGESSDELSAEDMELAADLADTSGLVSVDENVEDDDFSEEMVSEADAVPQVSEKEADFEEKLNAEIEATAQFHADVDEVDENEQDRDHALRLIESHHTVAGKGVARIDRSHDGGLSLIFHSGLKVKLQSHVLTGAKEFKIDDSLIVVRLDDSGEVEVDVDGIQISLPEAS